MQKCFALEFGKTSQPTKMLLIEDLREKKKLEVLFQSKLLLVPSGRLKGKLDFFAQKELIVFSGG